MRALIHLNLKNFCKPTEILCLSIWVTKLILSEVVFDYLHCSRYFKYSHNYSLEVTLNVKI